MKKEPFESGGEDREDVPWTERVNPVSRGIDVKDAGEVVELIHREDLGSWEAVGSALDSIATVVEAVVSAFCAGGRLVYVGAGTSGRLGALDAAECPPTFGVESSLVTSILAGGVDALTGAVEGAEDSAADGARAVADAGIRAQDVVCGIAASGKTPFVWGGLQAALERDATTVLITCNPGLPESLTAPLDFLVVLPVGPEVIAGSTRMKSGTATKMVLNMITTAAMIRWGKVYDNLMVDVVPVNEKLQRRARSLIVDLGDVAEERASELLHQAGGRVKVAVLMARGDLDPTQASRLLAENGGLLRKALERIAPSPP